MDVAATGSLESSVGQSVHSVTSVVAKARREGDINFGHKDVTDRVWEKVTSRPTFTPELRARSVD